MENAKMRIGVISDIHYGPLRIFKGINRGDGSSALEKLPLLFEKMDRQGVDIIINLGDNISEEENIDKNYSRLREIKGLFDKVKKPVYHILGNHECAKLEKSVSAEILGLDNTYYSVNLGNSCRLIFLDAQDHTCAGNIDDGQLSWLENELKNCSSAYIFSHQSLAEPDLASNPWFKGGPSGALIKNRKEVRKIIKAAGNVRMVVNGHIHQSIVQSIDNLFYCTINSWSEFKQDGKISEVYALIDINAGCFGSGIMYFGKDYIVNYDKPI